MTLVTHPNSQQTSIFGWDRVNKIKSRMEFMQALPECYLRSSTDYVDKLPISELKDEMNALFIKLVGFSMNSSHKNCHNLFSS